MTSHDGSPPERIRLFRSDRLEKLTVISPRGFALTWFVVLALVLIAGWGAAGIAVSTGLVLLGLLVWTLFEYAMHRFVFHLQPKSSLGRRVIFLMHGNHHVKPSDADRNLMPPIVSLAILGSVWLLFLALVGTAGSLLFLGFAIGYVAYDSVHYACHQLPTRGPVMRTLRRHHMRHHYMKRHGNYAITAIVWDRIFRTSLRLEKR